jgi:putative addiction module component (TIGR02574 family)
MTSAAGEHIRLVSARSSWNTRSVAKHAVDIDTLSKSERLGLIEELWESLDAEHDVPVSSAQRDELKARAEALKAGTLEMLDLDDVLDAIRSRRV